MRVSTNTIYGNGTGQMLRQQDALFRIQQQLSAGKSILTPSDDPIASVQALAITQSASINDQYSVNRNNAKSSLALEESVLKQVTEVLHGVYESAVQAGSGALTDADRKSIAIELRGQLESLVGLANNTDESGQFLFSGYQANTKPFVQTDLNVQYQGDQGQRLNQVGPTRQLVVGDPGSDVFEAIKNGNGVFTTTADSQNTGTGVIDIGSVVNPADLTGSDYEINFTVTAGVTTYDIVDATTGTTISSANPYVENSSISFDGMQVSIKGNPADGDKFEIAPSTNQSIFKTVGDLISTLESPTGGQSGGETRLANDLSTALRNISNGLDHILLKQSSIGSRMDEISTLEDVGSDQKIQYRQQLSQLQDVDYAQSISDFQRQQLYLQAAQQSYIKISGLTLFNFL